MKKIAITGGIGEGKSTILGYVKDLGIVVLSADDVAKEVLAEDKFQQAVANELHLKLPIDRKLLRTIILDDPALREKLNQILHPEILKRILASKISIIEVPLLFEASVQDYFDQIWVVTCGKSEQFKRLNARLKDPLITKKLIETQIPTAEKCKHADLIFDTRNAEEYLRNQVKQALEAEGFFDLL